MTVPPSKPGPDQPTVPQRKPAVQPGLGAAARATGLVTLASRFSGMIRDVLVVQVFGASALGSAFAAAFQIPNLFRRLFGEGALSAAFIPEYTLTERRSHEEADKLATYTLLRLAKVTATITVVVELLLLVLLVVLPSDPTGNREMSIKLMMVVFPFMPAVCMAAIYAGMLQVHGRFGASMSGAFLVNAFMVIVCIFYIFKGWIADPTVAYVLCIATVIAGFAQCYWFTRLLRKHFTWRPDCESAKPAASRMLKTFIPVMIGLGGLQISTFLDLSITMYPIWVGKTLLGYAYPLDEKSNIILRSTQLIYQFPLGVFGAAIATAAFPMLARAAENRGLFLDTLRRGLRLSIFIGLPASLGLILIREDVTRVLFSISRTRGFREEELARSAAVLLAFAPAVWSFSINQLLTRAFYAKGETMTPVRISLSLVVVNFVLSLIGIWFFKEAALGWSATATAFTQSFLLVAIAKKRFCPAGEPILDGPTRRSIGRVCAAAIVMAAIVMLTQSVWTLPDQQVLDKVTGEMKSVGSPRWLIGLRMMVCVALGAGVYIGEAIYSRSPELAWLLSRDGQKNTGLHRDLVVD